MALNFILRLASISALKFEAIKRIKSQKWGRRERRRDGRENYGIIYRNESRYRGGDWLRRVGRGRYGPGIAQGVPAFLLFNS